MGGREITYLTRACYLKKDVFFWRNNPFRMADTLLLGLLLTWMDAKMRGKLALSYFIFYSQTNSSNSRSLFSFKVLFCLNDYCFQRFYVTWLRHYSSDDFPGWTRLAESEMTPPGPLAVLVGSGTKSCKSPPTQNMQCNEDANSGPGTMCPFVPVVIRNLFMPIHLSILAE